MDRATISVIVPVYNVEKYLRKCLEGFVSQVCDFEYEVLIHDDASTDSSASIIKEFEEKSKNAVSSNRPGWEGTDSDELYSVDIHIWRKPGKVSRIRWSFGLALLPIIGYSIITVFCAFTHPLFTSAEYNLLAPSVAHGNKQIYQPKRSESAEYG